ncbi:MAG: hypothetical protein EOP83_10805 [Verrucomicrobiaceae bacterium]|nr:MAG: hypothetical protein EOP83_10805 [Verrucomicrobiaceae bacterium]
MRFFEISSGMRVPVNEEEQTLINRATESKRIRFEELEEREGEIARLMVTRGLLNREHDDDGEFYTVNDCADLWRF